MYWLSTIYFFLVTILTGTLVDLIVKDWEADWLEKLVMRLGVGLAAMSVEGVILNLLHIPLDYRVFLGIAILISICALFRNKRFRSIEFDRVASSLRQCWRNKTSWYTLFMFFLFGITLNMYVGGTFKYDYFEDTDPWRYTVVADYIGENKTFTAPYYSIQYSEPYPQGYQIVMGVLSQTNDSIYWTMKFFSTLIISFSVLFMYYFARRFSRNDEIALLAGFFLFAVPAWVTHFIFSLHFNMTIFIVLLYVLAQLMHEDRNNTSPTESNASIPAESETSAFAEEMRKEKSAWSGSLPGGSGRNEGWMYVGIVVYASMLINHFSTAVHGFIFCFALIVTRILAEKKIDWKTISIFFGGLLLSLLFYVPAYARHWWLTEKTKIIGGIGGLEILFPFMRFVVKPMGMATVTFVLLILAGIYWSRKYWQQLMEEWLHVGNRGLIIWLCGLALTLIILLQPKPILHALGTDDRWFMYSFSNFFYSGSSNRYHIPVGLGFILMSAVLASFLFASIQLTKLFKPVNAWVAVSFAWIITAFLLVLGQHLSIAIIPFRAWIFLGFFASLFGACGIMIFVRNFSNNHWVLWGVIALLAAIVTPTSFIPKYQHNTKIWRDVKIGTPQSRALFSWMRDGGIPKNSVVAHLCGDSEFLSGYDMNPPVWNEDFHPTYREKSPYFFAHPLIITPEAYAVLKNAEVEYVTVGASCYWQVYTDKERALMDTLLPRAMRGYMTDNRLIPIKSTGDEFLFKLK